MEVREWGQGVGQSLGHRSRVARHSSGSGTPVRYIRIGHGHVLAILFKKKKDVCCQVKKKKKKTVTHLTTKSAFRMDSLGHERFGSEGQRTC